MEGKVIRFSPKMRALGCLFIILSLLFIAAWGWETNYGLDCASSQRNSVPRRFAVLYFDASAGGNYVLGREIRPLPGLIPTSGVQDENDMISMLWENMEELIRGPKPGSSLAPTIPTGTQLLQLTIEEGIVRAVFSKELALRHWGGSKREEITVYSIANTLSHIPGVEGVKIEIEGEGPSTLAGHVSLEQVFTYNGELVE